MTIELDATPAAEIERVGLGKELLGHAIEKLRLATPSLEERASGTVPFWPDWMLVEPTTRARKSSTITSAVSLVLRAGLVLSVILMPIKFVVDA